MTVAACFALLFRITSDCLEIVSSLVISKYVALGSSIEDSISTLPSLGQLDYVSWCFGDERKAVKMKDME